jgi:hypothetical protein
MLWSWVQTYIDLRYYADLALYSYTDLWVLEC